MKNTMYRSISLLLALVLVLALVLLPGNDPANTVSASDLPVGEGVTLHCWNWSYKSIEENLPLIAGMGYTSIQTSPIQQAKQATAGYQYYDWWVYYQPASFSIDNTGNSALGTKAEFESMCRKAHSYGIKVIVDIVANHMGNQSGNDLAPSIIPDLRNDPSCWHDISRNTNDYSKRYDVTQWCMAGLPDLNTANKKVQNYVLSFMKECIDAAVAGFRFDVICADIDEIVPENARPQEVVMSLALQKAQAVAKDHRKSAVVGSDTVVALDGKILGKPHSEKEAVEMLRSLSGRIHKVYTGVAIVCGDKVTSFFDETEVEFYPLTDEEIFDYVATGEPMDKAGAYGIQGRGAVLVKRINGDYFNVMGLPISKVYRELKDYVK